MLSVLQHNIIFMTVIILMSSANQQILFYLLLYIFLNTLLLQAQWRRKLAAAHSLHSKYLGVVEVTRRKNSASESCLHLELQVFYCYLMVLIGSFISPGTHTRDLKKLQTQGLFFSFFLKTKAIQTQSF